MIRRHLPIAILLLTTQPLPPSAAAGPPDRMTFKNNLLPGHLSVHRIARVIRRTAERKEYVEKLKYRQRGRWVQCNVANPAPGRATVYQMMADEPAEVLSVHYGKKKIKPTPSASDFNLPKGSTRLQNADRLPRDAPVQVPLTDHAQRAVLHALLDFAHWPKKRVEAGHRWRRDIHGSGIYGTQTFEFVDLVKIKGNVVARVTLYVEGRFEEPLARDYVFGKGQALFYWSRLERTLIAMEARADYQRKRANAPEEFNLELEVGLLDLDALDEEHQNLVADQVAAFSEALNLHREHSDPEAREVLRRFRKTWPDSIWLPAVAELEDRTAKKPRPKRISSEQLSALLARAFITYEAARSNYEHDILERSRRTFEMLAEKYHAKLRKLSREGDVAERGRALFALAFGTSRSDLEYIQKAARDESWKIRVMALAGLAARRDRHTSVELLIISLEDDKAAVRRRACQAVASCVPPEHYSVVKVVEELIKLMTNDESDGVRLEAVRALAVSGAPADVPRLENALEREKSPDVRAAIDKAIEKLQAKDG